MLKSPIRVELEREAKLVIPGSRWDKLFNRNRAWNFGRGFLGLSDFWQLDVPGETQHP